MGIVPVEYSEVVISAPSTTMTSWPSMTSPMTLFCVASKPARSWADMWGHWCTASRQ